MDRPASYEHIRYRGRHRAAVWRWSSHLTQYTDAILRWDVTVSTASISSQSLLAAQLAKICKCVLIKHRTGIICVLTPGHQLWMFFPLWGASTLPSAVLLHPTDVRLDWDLGSFEAGYDHLGPLSCSSNGICDLAGQITLPGWFCVAAVMFGRVVRSEIGSTWMQGTIPFFLFFSQEFWKINKFCCKRKRKYVDLAYLVSSMESQSIYGVSTRTSCLHTCLLFLR